MRHASLLKRCPILGWMGMLLLTGITGADASALTSFSDPSLSLSVQNQHLSAQIDRISLQTVLSALSAQLPITFILKGINQDNRISTSFTNLPFDQGLERLLAGYDYAIIHVPIEHLPSDVPSEKSTEVVVLSRNQNFSTMASSVAPLIPPPTFPSQSPSLTIHQEPKKEDHTQSPGITTTADEQDVIPLLEQVLEESDPETPRLIQELLTKSEPPNE